MRWRRIDDIDIGASVESHDRRIVGRGVLSQSATMLKYSLLGCRLHDQSQPQNDYAEEPIDFLHTGTISFRCSSTCWVAVRSRGTSVERNCVMYTSEPLMA